MRQTRKLAQISLSLVMILSIGLSLTQPKHVSAQGEDGIQRQVNAQTGKVSLIAPASGGPLSAARVLGISVSPEDPAMALVKRFAPEFGLRNPERDLTEIETDRPGGGRVTVRYQQNYQGIPVLAGELIVNTNEDGDLYSINGETSREISMQAQPAIDPKQARQTALQSLAKWYQRAAEDFIATEPELWVYDESLLRPSTRPVELVWRIEVTSVDHRLPVRELVLVNAQRGGISLHFNQVDSAWKAPRESTRTRTTTSMLSAGLATGAIIKTYTAGNSTSLPGTFLCDQTNPNCAAGDSHAKAAHKYAIGTYNLFKTEHSRNSIDNNNMAVISTVHYDYLYANAFWSGTQMVYGDGYGFALADDVVAHELTHGVTQHESNLFYYYQSGAINESLSDIWGEYYDQINGQGTDSAGVKWLIGEDISGLGAIRNMSHPPAFGDPDRMTSDNYFEGGQDNGGVHYNSGVNNKAVFLMVEGGTFNGRTVTALGWSKTAAIYYEVNTNLLASGADYSDLYFALQQACTNLIGQKGINSSNCQEVKDAIDAVEMNAQPAPNFNTDAPLCDAGTPSFSFSDGLENGSGNWNFANGAHKRWQVDSPYGPYAQSGIHSLYADDYPAVVADVTASLAPLIVPDNAFLHFAHAYDFESYGDPYHFDGGVLEYRISGQSAWVDAGPLMEFNGYKGTVYSDWTNPLAGRQGFVGSSHGYISTRLNLTSLAGKSVAFRWRMGLDDIGYAWGWWVDNIKVYTCGNTIPAAATLVSPAGDIGTNYTPTYTWNKVSDATWYYLWVDGPSGNVIKQWHQASTVCGASTCSVTPSVMLRGGAHRFWVRTWNNGGYGPWSAVMDFSTTIPALPGQATLVTPNGDIGSNYTPTYTWNKVSGATWYYLWVDGPSGNVIKQWHQASDVCGASICSITPATILKGGAHIWWIRTWNNAGHGPWSESMSFSTTIPTPPGKATLVSPSGLIDDPTPTYTWSNVSGATWYYLWVSKVSGDGSLTTIHTKWYEGSGICSGANCSFTPAVILGTGNYTWWIRTWDSTGYGPWSSATNFSIP